MHSNNTFKKTIKVKIIKARTTGNQNNLMYNYDFSKK